MMDKKKYQQTGECVKGKARRCICVDCSEDRIEPKGRGMSGLDIWGVE